MGGCSCVSCWLVACVLAASLGVLGCGSSPVSKSSSSGGSSSRSTGLIAHSSLLWQTEFGGASLPALLPNGANPPGNQITGLAAAANGGVVICGSTLSAFPSYTNANDSSEAVVARFSDAGRSVWTTEFGTGD